MVGMLRPTVTRSRRVLPFGRLILLSVLAAVLAVAVFGALAASDATSPAQALQTRLTFALWGDVRPDNTSTTGASPYFTRVARNLGTRAYGFSIAVGDYVYLSSSDSQSTMTAKYRGFLTAEAPIRKAPVYYVPGNHELLDNSTARGRYHSMLPVPARDWYAKRFGSLRILFLSSVEPGRVEGSIGFAGEGSSSNSAQATWLVATLRTIARDAPRAWVLVVVHHPLHDPKTSAYWATSGERGRLDSLFAKYGVDGVLQGDVHYYRRHVAANRITYLTQGTGGAPIKSRTYLPIDRYDLKALGDMYGYTMFVRGADNTLRGVTYEASASDWQFAVRDRFDLTNRRAQ